MRRDENPLPWLAGNVDRNAKGKSKDIQDVNMQSIEDLSDGEVTDESD